MKTINSAEEFKEIYPYKGEYGPEKKQYPKKYPCFAWVYSVDGGLMGDYSGVHIVYPPEGVDMKSYELGLKEGLKYADS